MKQKAGTRSNFYFDTGTEVMYEKGIILRKYTLKYLQVKELEVSKLLLNSSKREEETGRGGGIQASSKTG